MEIQVAKLREVLNTVKLGISVSENIDQSNHFIFKDGKVYAFNNEIIVIKKSPVKIEGAVIASEFLQVLEKFKTDTVNIKEKEDMFIINSSEKKRKTTAGISFTKDITLPLDEVGEIDDLNWKKVPKGFSEGLILAAPNASRESSKGILQCIHVNKDKIEATDNYNVIKVPLSFKMKEFCIYGPSAFKISSFIFTRYCVEESWVFFKSKDGTIVGTRNFGGDNYPSLSHFFKDFKGVKRELPKELKNSLSKAQIFVSANSEDLIELKVEKGWVNLIAKGPTGFLKEKIKLSGKMKDFAIDISLPQLQFLMNHSAVIEFGSSVARIESDKSTYICALR